MEIAPGSPEGNFAVTDDSFVMKSEPIFDLENVFKKADSIATDIQISVASLREFATDDENLVAIRETVRDLNKSVNKVYEYLEANEENIALAVANLKDVSANLVQVSARAKVFMEEGGQFETISEDVELAIAQLRGDLKAIVEDANSTVNELRSTLSNVDERSERFTTSAVDLMDSTKQDIQVMTKNLDEATQNLNVIIARVRAGQGTVGRLMTDPQPFEDMKDSISAIRGFLTGNQNTFYDVDIRYSGKPSADQPSLLTNE